MPTKKDVPNETPSQHAAFEAIVDALWARSQGEQPPLAGSRRELSELLAPGAKTGQTRGSSTRSPAKDVRKPDEENRREQTWGKVFAALMERLSPDYGECAKSGRSLLRCFHRELAACLQPRINAYLRTLPCDTYAEKQHVATWVNEQLREFGLAIRCPRTGRAGNLLADVQGGEDSASRFRLDVRNEDGTRTRTVSSRGLFDLELMEDTAREEPLSRKARDRRG